MLHFVCTSLQAYTETLVSVCISNEVHVAVIRSSTQGQMLYFSIHYSSLSEPLYL